MGQSSSQVAPSQQPTSTEVVPQLDGQMDPPPKPSRKRNREVADDNENAVRVVKKSKRERRSSGRAVPQHKRGTAIKPRNEETVDEPQASVDPVEDMIIVNSPRENKRGDQQASNDGVIGGGVDKPEPKKKRKRDKPTTTPAIAIEPGQVTSKHTEHPQVVIEVQQPVGHAQPTSGGKPTGVNAAKTTASTRQSRPKRQHTSAHEAWDEAKRKLEESRIRHAKEKEEASSIPAQPQPEVGESVNTQATGGAKNADIEDEVAIDFESESAPRRKEKKDRKRNRNGNATAQPSEEAKENVDPANHPTPPDSAGPLVSPVSDAAPKRKRKKKQAVPEPQSKEQEANLEDEAEPTQELLDSQLDVDETANTKPKKKAKKSKKSTAMVEPTELDDEFVPETQSATHRSPVNSGAMADEANTRPHDMKQFSSADRGAVSGKWSAEELDLADKVFADFCKHNNISEAELRLKTTTWADLGPFKVRLYEAFPDRKIDNIRKHMQRRFSPYTKGEWSEEETQRLKDAYAKYPEQWPQIAREVERTQQACRDRYKNFIQYEQVMDRGAWTITEEVKLARIVDEALELIQKNTEDDDIRTDKDKAESYIHWSEIANKMDGKRSKKRCFEKWKLLKRRGEKPPQQPRGPLTATITGAEDETEAKRMSRKKAAVERLYAHMKPADIYTCLSEFVQTLTRIPDTDFHDDSTFWSVIAQRKLPDAIFAYTPLVRRTYFAAIERYDCKKVRRAEGYREKARKVLKRMRKLARTGEVDLEDAFYGPEDKAVPRHRSKKQRKKVSEDVVESEEEEAELDAVVPETQEEQDEDAEEDEDDDDEEAEANGVQDAESLRSGTPQISPEEFMEKCRQAGKKQHRAYLAGHGR